MASSRQISTQSLVLVASIGVCAGLYYWALFIATFSHDGAIGPYYNAPGTDWMVFYSAARAYLDGNLALIFDGHRFTAHQNEVFAGWLSTPLPFHPWLYPPHYLLLVLPFGLMPFAVSYVLVMLLTFAALLAVMWQYAERRRDKWLQVTSLLLCPATALNVIAGQNAFLTSALLVGGFGLLARHPVAAGVLLGVLTYKPSLWLMVPVALIAARQWRAFGSATATALVLALAGLAVFGFDAWRLWLEQTVTPSADFYRSWLISGRLWGQSIYTWAVVLGASHSAANAVQAGATLAAGALVYWTFRRPFPDDLRLIILMAAAILAAPHVSGYDTLLLAIAASLFLSRLIAEDGAFLHVIMALPLWLSPLFNPPMADPIGLATPLLICLFIISVLSTALVRPQPSAMPAV